MPTKNTFLPAEVPRLADNVGVGNAPANDESALKAFKEDPEACESHRSKIGDLNVYPGVWTPLGDRAQPTNALLEACFKADAPGVQAALDAGAVVNHSGPKGRTPLHLAAMLRAPRASVAICSMLIAHKADVHLRDEGSNTALHFAAMNPQRGLFAGRLLLTFDANGLARNAEGDTPMDIAQRNGTEQLVTIIRSRKPPGA
eukprot:gnl/MRDRNA2_/MRDRNA2_125550_c0_seq1.p1 gnl/MRDRNA2_/MRDRNA2_125550_c0~~gnl/MRDRNA2_/MRDRNA2_125550_c0_seq1.p1  ORF type:complete len:201 (-),score=48.18 gnl/MRDRNA2_/MRDRNA2_125550_c0_seq1:52-654(-)